MPKANLDAIRKSDGVSFLSAELIDAQGKNDRELLTQRVKLLLEAKDKHPSATFSDLSNIADLTACGAGCCCCCDTLVLPGSTVVLGDR